MTALLLQTFLLLLPPFLIGAALACGLRQMLQPAAKLAASGDRTVTPAAPVVPLPQYASRAQEAVVTTVTPAQSPAVAPAASTPAAGAPPAPTRFDTSLRPTPQAQAPAPAPPPAPSPASVVASTSSPSPATRTAVVEPAVPRAAPPPPPAPAVAAVAAAPAAAPVAPSATSTLVRAAEDAATKAATLAASAAAAAVLAAQAKATAPPVAELTTPTSFPASGAAAPVGGTSVVVPLVRDTVVPTRRTDADADDLTRISLIDGPLAAQLSTLGVTKFSQIAAWRKPDVDAISASLGFKERIEQENWIEQAQVLNNGSETQYSLQRARVATSMATAPDVRAAVDGASPSVATEAKPTAVKAEPLPPVGREQSAAPVDGVGSSLVGAAPVTIPVPAVDAQPLPSGPPPATVVRPDMAPVRDSLQRISTINAEVERLLSAQGITRYNQIASWGPTDIERYDRLLGSPGRITRENWVEQAQMLAKGGDTAYSRDIDRRAANVDPPAVPAVRPASITDAIRANASAVVASVAPISSVPRADISGLRSVRSEAYRADAAVSAGAGAVAAGTGAKVVRSAQADDLKRIRGVGVLIEKRLNSIGVVAYDQIADWTNDDIDRVSATLDFKGRIERENWVEQARILAAGGQTEFSRRVDRGEMEIPRPR